MTEITHPGWFEMLTPVAARTNLNEEEEEDADTMQSSWPKSKREKLNDWVVPICGRVEFPSPLLWARNSSAVFGRPSMWYFVVFVSFFLPQSRPFSQTTKNLSICKICSVGRFRCSKRSNLSPLAPYRLITPAGEAIHPQVVSDRRTKSTGYDL